MLNEKTFGKSEAAIVLAKILSKEENKFRRRYVSSTLGEYNQFLNKISFIKEKDVQLAVNFATFQLNMLLEKINKSKNLTEEIKNFSSNVLCYKHKVFCEFKENITTKLKFHGYIDEVIEEEEKIYVRLLDLRDKNDKKESLYRWEATLYFSDIPEKYKDRIIPGSTFYLEVKNIKQKDKEDKIKSRIHFLHLKPLSEKEIQEALERAEEMVKVLKLD